MTTTPDDDEKRLQEIENRAKDYFYKYMRNDILWLIEKLRAAEECLAQHEAAQEQCVHTCGLGITITAEEGEGKEPVAPIRTLFGRPVVPVEGDPALATIGDIVFDDFSRWIKKEPLLRGDIDGTMVDGFGLRWTDELLRDALFTPIEVAWRAADGRLYRERAYVSHELLNDPPSFREFIQSLVPEGATFVKAELVEEES